jgi:hypothetical protein
MHGRRRLQPWRLDGEQRGAVERGRVPCPLSATHNPRIKSSIMAVR